MWHRRPARVLQFNTGEAPVPQNIGCCYDAAMRDLNGMIVVITGASSGIGAALARTLDRAEARLVLAARREDRLNALNTDLGNRHVVIPADVSKQDDCERLIERSIAALGRIDTLVCNAGYGIYPLVHETTPADVRAIFATNVYGTTDCIYAAMPHMLKQPITDGWRGQVMIVSSAAARRAVPYLGVYSATKAAQLSIAEAMRVELRPMRVAVTSVHPIMTTTEFGEQAERTSNIKLPRGGGGFMTQTAEHVVERMRKAIQRPTAEVWPSRMSRLALGLGTLMPRWVDRAMRKFRENIEAENRS